jgi:hypothetical protein
MQGNKLRHGYKPLAYWNCLGVSLALLFGCAPMCAAPITGKVYLTGKVEPSQKSSPLVGVKDMSAGVGREASMRAVELEDGIDLGVSSTEEVENGGVERSFMLVLKSDDVTKVRGEGSSGNARVRVGIPCLESNDGIVMPDEGANMVGGVMLKLEKLRLEGREDPMIMADINDGRGAIGLRVRVLKHSSADKVQPGVLRASCAVTLTLE